MQMDDAAAERVSRCMVRGSSCRDVDVSRIFAYDLSLIARSEWQGEDTTGRSGAREMAGDERLMSAIKVVNWIGFNPSRSPHARALERQINKEV